MHRCINRPKGIEIMLLGWAQNGKGLLKVIPGLELH